MDRGLPIGVEARLAVDGVGVAVAFGRKLAAVSSLWFSDPSAPHLLVFSPGSIPGGRTGERTHTESERDRRTPDAILGPGATIVMDPSQTSGEFNLKFRCHSHRRRLRELMITVSTHLYSITRIHSPPRNWIGLEVGRESPVRVRQIPSHLSRIP